MEEISGWADLKDTLKVKLKIFEGPLDLLLHLIRSNKIDIYDIPMAEITSQYLEYLELMKDLNLDIASEFLVMAATLMHIKSRMLLPVSEEGYEEEDPRIELVQQLLEYQRYKEAALNLKEKRSNRELLFSRQSPEMPETQDEIYMDVSLFELLKVFREVISVAREGPAMMITPEKFSVVEKMRIIIEKLGVEGKLIFKNLFEKRAEKGEIIAALLAVLELVRLQMIRLMQPETGGDICIMRVKGSKNERR